MDMEKLRRYSDVPWRDVSADDGFPLALVAPSLFEILTGGDAAVKLFEPLYAADDGKDDGGDQVVMCRETIRGLPADQLIVCLPGVCGHFNCGNIVRVSLN